MGQLRDRMEADLTIAGYSPDTKRIYLLYAKQFAAYHRRSPAEMGSEEIRQFLLHLIVERGISRSTFKQVHAALRFLYSVTLRRAVEIEWVPVGRKPKRLPNILSGTEVEAFLGAVRDPKYRALFTTMYAGGLRISEARRLRPENIDSKRMVIRVCGKGNQERLSVLSPRLLHDLRCYWKEVRPGDGWLFPGYSKGTHVSAESSRRAFHKAIADAKIAKKVTPHTLRHSFATHLIDTGVALTTVQALLGHRQLQTTGIYTHTTVERIARTRSPFDLLGTPAAQVLG